VHRCGDEALRLAYFFSPANFGLGLNNGLSRGAEMLGKRNSYLLGRRKALDGLALGSLFMLLKMDACLEGKYHYFLTVNIRDNLAANLLGKIKIEKKNSILSHISGL
jgi:hypothetical protein